MRKSIFTFSVCLSLSFAAYGQALLSPYTANMLALRQFSDRQAASGEQVFDAYIYVKDASTVEAIRALDIKVGLELGNLVTARVPLSKLNYLCGLDGVSYIEFGTEANPMMDKARAATYADAMMDGIDGLEHGYKGKGVVVGIVDTGFDYTHPNFYDASREQLRIRKVWEQSTENASIAGAEKPANFSYGTEFDTPEEILAAATDLQNNSHGTHVAGIAAGADVTDANPYYGIAGEADIVLVSRKAGDGSNVNISDAIAYIYEYADEVGKPCVVNLSLGTQIGPHDGSSSFDQIADKMQGEGRLLIGSVGNFGAKKLHVGSTGEEPVKTFVHFMEAPSNSNVGGDVDIWGEEGAAFTLQLLIVNKNTNEIVSASENYPVTSEGGTYTFEPASPTRGKVVVTTEINPLNGKPHALVTSGITSMRSSYALGIIVTPTQKGTVHLWADGNKVLLTNEGLEGWADGTTACTLAEIGGTGKRIVSVGAFVTSHGTGQQFPADEIGAIASFSSQGPTADGRMKPDVTAPGSYIAASLSSYFTPTTGTVASDLVWNERTYQYGYMEGTSMASPFVAGIVAAWLQAYPKMTPEDLRTVLQTTATVGEYTKASSENENVWGYGKINALEGLKKVLELASQSGIESEYVSEPGFIVSLSEGWKYIPSSSVSSLSFTLSDVSGNVVMSNDCGSLYAGDEIFLPAQGLVHGLYLLRVVCDGTVHSFKLLH